MNEHDQFMNLAIQEARKCTPEDERIHPKVGVVVVKDGKILATGYRGELENGEHAEYTVLEKKLHDDDLSGAVIYTTLEPCTSRNHPKIPCANRLISRRVSKVVIGILDPNPQISGRGQQLLQEANIETEIFPLYFSNQISDLNREFIRSQKQQGSEEKDNKEFINLNRGRSLDSWYEATISIYGERNYHRSTESVFTHLVEVIGGLSLFASAKKKPGINRESFVPKTIAWWMALCSKAGISSVSEMIWTKFPSVCPYCQNRPHDQDECREKKAARPGPDWKQLARIAQDRQHNRPKSLGEWQKMFASIYPIQQTEEYGMAFARLTEELGELAEAVRILPKTNEYFMSEASDVFAWIMHIQNLSEYKEDVLIAQRGLNLEESFCKLYPDRCTNCGHKICTCPAILESTMGRIAHERPHHHA